MSRTEGVTDVLISPWKPAQPSEPTDGRELLTPSCQDLMGIALMTDVPNEAVLWKIEDPVERNGQFHHTKVRGKMPTAYRDHTNDFIADFLCQPW